MGEGVDPTQMCQSLVDKVAQSKQLMAITDPEILVLFEDWLEELENEVVSLAKTHGGLNADEFGLESGAFQARRNLSFIEAEKRKKTLKFRFKGRLRL